MSRYTATIHGRSYSIVTEEDGSITVNGQAVQVELRRTRQGPLLVSGDKTWEVRLLQADIDGDSINVALNGKVIPVFLEDERSALLHSLQSEKATRVHSAVIRSPMPGRISKLLVSQGELIETGQGLFILEAMKMENEIKAPCSGIVKHISVNEGDAVEKNVVLIEIS